MNLILVDEVCILKDGFIKNYEVEGKKIVIVQSDGKVYAIEDKCGHHCVPLHDGEVTSNLIRCKVHGIQFSLQDGRQQNRFDDETDTVEVFTIAYSDDDKEFGIYI